MKYKIRIEEVTDYKKTTVQYEAADGKRYTSTYSVPDRVEYKEVTMETGETGYATRTVYEQEYEADSLVQVIKAVNELTS